MKDQDIIMTSAKEIYRLKIIDKFIEKQIKQIDAAGLLKLSTRQVRRIAEEIKSQGPKAVAHKLRSRPSNRSKKSELKNKALDLCRQKYAGFGPTLLAEKLENQDNIKLGKETIRRWLLREGIPFKKRKKKPFRTYRERKHFSGEMVQVDGSHHAWFEDRGPVCVFMGYIDDATSNIFGRFYPYEGTIPAMDSFYRYILKYGLPASVYLDNHAAYRSKKKPTIEDELYGRVCMSQFERALHELGVGVIHAHSPQAKGRVERLFGTLQDRLVKELKLLCINDIESANSFLDSYLEYHNRRFAIKALEETDLHMTLGKELNLCDILCIKTQRVLRNDNTVFHDKKLFQVLENVNAKKVIVQEHIDGRLVIKYNGKSLGYLQIKTRPATVQIKEVKQRRPFAPAPDHPWRRYKNKIDKVYTNV